MNRFPQMPENDGGGNNPYTGTIPKRRKPSPMTDSVLYQGMRFTLQGFISRLVCL